MRLWQHREVFVAIEPRDDEAVGHGCRVVGEANHEVGSALTHQGERVVGLHLDEPNFNAGVGAGELGERCGQSAGAKRVEGGDAKAPHLQVRVAVQRALCAFQARGDRVGMFHERLARGGEQGDASRPHREWHPCAAFECRDVVRNGGFAQREGAGGGGFGAVAANLAQDQ